LTSSPNQKHDPRVLTRLEGRIASRHETRVRMRWTRAATRTFFVRTNGADADGEVVWSWRPDAGAKSCGCDPHGDGGKKARSPARARRTPLKPSRREGRLFGQTCGDCRQLFYLLAGHGCGLHPAFPAPSSIRGSKNDTPLGYDRAARMRCHVARPHAGPARPARAAQCP